MYENNDELQEITEQKEWISASEAAQILGVTSSTVKTYGIPFQQYMPRSKVTYRRQDVLDFKEKSFSGNRR